MLFSLLLANRTLCVFLLVPHRLWLVSDSNRARDRADFIVRRTRRNSLQSSLCHGKVETGKAGTTTSATTTTSSHAALKLLSETNWMYLCMYCDRTWKESAKIQKVKPKRTKIGERRGKSRCMHACKCLENGPEDSTSGPTRRVDLKTEEQNK
jgi:hypothetical protein